MSGLQWSGWAGAAVVGVCAAVGLWHHRRDAARLARCAHELRGSLGALRLGLDLALNRGGLSPARLQALDLQLDRATLALQELDGWRWPGGAAAAEAGEREQVHIDALVGDTVAALAPLADSRGVKLSVDGVPAISLPGSPARLAQALSNLVQNAIQHGAGPVIVAGRVGEGSVRLEVSDHGPGLQRALHRLSGPGRGRWWAAPTGRHGHGLPVAAAVAAAHGGRLLNAPTTQGTRLVLELPLPGADRPHAPGAGRAPVRVA